MESTEQKSSIAVFDVCDTLYFSNTTNDFVRFVVSSTQRGRTKHWMMNSRFLPFRYLFIAISKYLGKDPLRSLNVGLLKGYSRIELAELARDFVETFLKDRKIEKVHESVNRLRSAGQQVILCSTSIEPVVAAIAADLGRVNHISSSLEYIADICTGQIDDDVGTSKLVRLNDMGFEGGIDVAYSDNLGDLKLLRAARHPVAVVHSERKKAFWIAHKIEILRP